MREESKELITRSIREFHMPRYREIPDMGLFLEQTAKYIADVFRPLESVSITGSMISNYVKKGLVDKPVKKQYNRDQIAYLMFIAAAKTVLSLENIQLMISLQKKTYTPEVAYNYLCEELENVLAYCFGMREQLETVGRVSLDRSDEKMMLRKLIITVAHKVYLDKFFDRVRAENESEEV